MDCIKLPPHLKQTKSLEWKVKYDKFNILYVIIKHLFPETAHIKDGRKIPDKYLKKFNLKNFTFPLVFSDLKKFVRKNSHLPMSLSVLFEFDEGEISNLGIFSNQKKKEQNNNLLHLLMVKHDPNLYKTKELDITSKCKNIKDLKQQHHFFKITSLRGFLNNRARMSKNKSIAEKYYYCENCLLNFRSQKKQKRHQKNCNDKQQEFIYPEKNTYLYFDKQRHKFKAPIVGFCDFESALQRNLERSKCKFCSKLECLCAFPTSSDINVHKPVGYSILFVDSNEKVFLQEEYAGEDAVEHFLKQLRSYEKKIEERKQLFRGVDKIKAGPQDWKKYNEATVCHICHVSFDKDKNEKDPRKKNLRRKVPDHDHVTGKMLGAAHSICNLFRRGPYHTPIYFHNAQGYFLI